MRGVLLGLGYFVQPRQSANERSMKISLQRTVGRRLQRLDHSLRTRRGAVPVVAVGPGLRVRPRRSLHGLAEESAEIQVGAGKWQRLAKLEKYIKARLSAPLALAGLAHAAGVSVRPPPCAVPPGPWLRPHGPVAQYAPGRRARTPDCSAGRQYHRRRLRVRFRPSGPLLSPLSRTLQ